MGDIGIVEFGEVINDQGPPVFNLLIAMDKTNRVSLLYEEYPGSISDVSQFTFMVDLVIEYRYKKIGFILDRGYFSKENIRYIDAYRVRGFDRPQPDLQSSERSVPSRVLRSFKSG